MENYVIATSSTADLDAAWLKENGVPFISYNFVIDETSYEDDCTDKTKDFILDAMNNDKSVSTSAVTTYAYYEFFKKYLAEGKDILFLDMTKALSSSYNNSLIAAQQLKEEYPDRRLEIIDTNSVTTILGLLVKHAVEMKKAGSSMDEVVSWTEENKNHFVGRFMVNDLKWLRRGGRLSNASAVVGSLLSIKPLIYVDDEGKLIAYSKVRGNHKAKKQLIEDVKKSWSLETPEHEISIIYSGDRGEAEEFKEQLAAAYPDAKDINLYRLGPVIMGHIGPGFLAVIIYGTSRTA